MWFMQASQITEKIALKLRVSTGTHHVWIWQQNVTHCIVASSARHVNGVVPVRV